MALAVAEAGRVLKRGGRLLDIHPLDEPNALEIWHARYGASLAPEAANLEAVERARAGWFDQLDETLADFTASTDALALAVEGPDFELERSATFEYRYFFDSLDELTDYLEDNWEHAVASDALLEQATRLLRQAPTPAKLVVVQNTALTALRRR